MPSPTAASSIDEPKLWKPTTGKRLGSKLRLKASKLLSGSSHSNDHHTPSNSKGGSTTNFYNLATGEGSEQDDELSEQFMTLLTEEPQTHHVVSAWEYHDHLGRRGGSPTRNCDDEDEHEDNDLNNSKNYNNDVHWWMTPQFDPEKPDAVQQRNPLVVQQLEDKIAQLEAERDQLQATCETQERQLFDAMATKMTNTTTTTTGTPSTAAMSTTTTSMLWKSSPASAVSPFHGVSGEEDNVFDFFGLLMDDESGRDSCRKSVTSGRDQDSLKTPPTNMTTEQITFQGFPAAVAATATSTHKDQGRQQQQQEDMVMYPAAATKENHHQDPFPTPSTSTGIEIDGMSLLDERDHLFDDNNRLLTGATVQQYKDLKQLMTFNSLQLIQKQRKWLEAMSGKKSPASMISIVMELENLERKIRGPTEEEGEKKAENLTEEEIQLLEAAVEAGKARAEGEKPPFVPMEPSKAMFKAMALLDDSLHHFQKGCMKGFGKMNQLVKSLKEDVDGLEAKNAELLVEISQLHKQHHTQTSMNKALLTSLEKLKSERDGLASQMKTVGQGLASLVPPSAAVYAHATPEEEKKDEDDDDVGKAALAKIERVQDYINSLKNTAQADIEFESELCSISQEVEGGSQQHTQVMTELRQRIEQLTKTNETLLAQHSSEKKELRANLEASWKQVDHLTASLSERNNSIANFVQQNQLAKIQLANLVEDNKGYKAVADEKASLLLTATSRIDVLQGELLRVEEELRTVEMDFAEYKASSMESLRNADKEWSTELENAKAEHEETKQTLQAQLDNMESERDRMVRDLKAAIVEAEAERDQMKATEATTKEKSGMVDVRIAEEANGSVRDLEDQFQREDQFEHLRSKMAHRASSQTNLIAQLQHENELKDAHLQEMKELIEHLSERQGGLKTLLVNAKERKWGSLISKLSDRSLHGP